MTTKLATILAPVALAGAGYDGIFPKPINGKPIKRLSFVHEKVVIEPPIKLASIGSPAHTVMLCVGATEGVPFTFISKFCDKPIHEFKVGVTVTVVT